MSLRRAHVPSASVRFGELWRSLHGQPINDAERQAAEILGVPEVVMFATARGALASSTVVLADGLPVALPAFTCIAVLNALVSAGADTQFIDVDPRGLVGIADWPRDSLCLLQDTFGFEAEVPPGRDCLRDSTHRPDLVKSVTTVPEVVVAVTSFEHSKSLSAGRGGLATTASARLAARLREARDNSARSPDAWHDARITALTTAMGRLLYRGHRIPAKVIGEFLLRLDPARMLGQSQAELGAEGVDASSLGRPSEFAAAMMISQLHRLDDVTRHRAGVVALYDEAAGVKRTPVPLVRYPMLISDPECFEREARASGWNLGGRWFVSPLHPLMERELGMLRLDAVPNSLRLARSVINLPTHPLVTCAHAGRLIDIALAAGATPVT